MWAQLLQFLRILLKLHWCFGHGLTICMWFGYNPQIIIIFFFTFSQVELTIFSGNFYNKVNGQGIPCGRNSSYSFIPILSKLHWPFGHGLKICTLFGYNPQMFFYYIKPQLNIYYFSSIFRLQYYQYLLNVYIYVVHLSANAPTVLYSSL